MFPQILYLGKIVNHYVRLIRVTIKITLMVILGFVERLERGHFGDDRAVKDFGLVELNDISLGNALLFFVAIEDHRTILRPRIRSLTIQFSRVVPDRKEDL